MVYYAAGVATKPVAAIRQVLAPSPAWPQGRTGPVACCRSLDRATMSRVVMHIRLENCVVRAPWLASGRELTGQEPCRLAAARRVGNLREFGGIPHEPSTVALSEV